MSAAAMAAEEWIGNMSKKSLSPDKPEFLDMLDKAWSSGKYCCPECGRELELSTLVQLQDNTCSQCGKSFFMPRKLGEYYLYEQVASGGMGSVFKGVSRKFQGFILAIKLLARAARENPSNIRGLLNESEVCVNFLESEYIAACVDSGFIDDEYYTVMPFVEGERLDARIARLGKLPLEEVLPMLMHILAAEQHVYRHGFLFRDMKPENIIINEFGYAVLLDFGLCIPLEQARNPQDEFISGSPYFIPPERLLGEPEDACSEIYSIGMVAYNALTGHTIYDADDLDALAHRHVAKMKVSNASKMGGIDPEFAKIIERMIRREAAERQQTFLEVADEIRAFQAKYNPNSQG